MLDSSEFTPTRPYLIRALYEWCVDNGFTPFLAVAVDTGVQVPMEYVKDGQIVLNISMDATGSLKLGNDFIEFKARFGGVSRDIFVPVTQVTGIYARENGQGMAFPVDPPETKKLLHPKVKNPSSPLGVVTAPTTEARATPQLVDVGTNQRDGGSSDTPDSPPPPKSGSRPALKIVK